MFLIRTYTMSYNTYPLGCLPRNKKQPSFHFVKGGERGTPNLRLENCSVFFLFCWISYYYKGRLDVSPFFSNVNALLLRKILNMFQPLFGRAKNGLLKIVSILNTLCILQLGSLS